MADASAAIQTVRLASSLNVAAGLWLIAAPFILDFASIEVAMWNDICVGVIVAVIALIRIAKPVGTEKLGLLSAAAGVWLMAAQWLYSYPADAIPRASNVVMWNDNIVGMAIIVFAGWSAVYSKRAKRRGA